MWVIDIRHWLNDERTEAGLPQLRNKVKKMTEIITYATSTNTGLKSLSVPQCWRRPNRKPCPGKLEIIIEQEKEIIHYYCSMCEDEGVIHGWRGLIWDMSEDVNKSIN